MTEPRKEITHGQIILIPHFSPPSSTYLRALGEELDLVRPHVFLVASEEGHEENMPVNLRQALQRNGVKYVHVNPFTGEDKHDLQTHEEAMKGALGKAFELFEKGQADKALDSYAAALRSHKLYFTLAGNAIKRTLANLPSLLAQDETMRRKNEIVVMLPLESNIWRIERELRKMGFKDVRPRLGSPFHQEYLDPGVIALRQEVHSISGTARLNILARSFVAVLLAQRGGRIGLNDPNANALGNLLARNLTLEQFRAISRQVAEEKKADKSGSFYRAFRAVGIEVPITGDVALEVIRRQGIRVAPQ